MKKDHIDTFGAAALIGFSLLLAVNQVVTKLTYTGIQPVFFAGIRSLGAALCIWAFFRLRGRPIALGRGRVAWAGAICGVVFAVEFLALFLALDLTNVTRTSILFYSMPVWTLLAGHFILRTERISGSAALGLLAAMAGVALALAERGGQAASLAGDLCAVGAGMGWAATLLIAKHSALRELRPEGQLLWQVAVSAPILLLLAPLFGPLIRDFAPIHLAGIGFQIVVVVSFGFIFWLWLLSIYPAGGVASFSFLAPVFSVGLGWLVLGERLTWRLFAALALVALGIVLINRRRPVPPPDA
ncbi:DMT family transporter [Pseudoroseicyclus tamaricis]|uniref:DMT family transporter n=1 Tax=Pseudoroseicyclus tamaricis TaxID=2705421 RepID=A0A6B2JSA5_9RHOB|nr:DMT family transporter [Pseudoroseicyclus tamaricis]NDV00860.1 DMT family transporter [Pseudoroseicyclus tamaricis]